MSDSDSDFEVSRGAARRRTSSEQTTNSRNVESSSQVRGLVRVAERFAARSRQIRNDPESAESFALEIAAAFRSSRSPTASTLRPRPRNYRGRPTTEFPVRLVCLRSPTMTNVSRLRVEDMENVGLGPVQQDRGLVRLPLSWTRGEMDNFLVETFPALSGTRFHLFRSRRGGHLDRLPDTCKEPAVLKEHLIAQRTRRLTSPPTIYVIPDRAITHRPLGTPTVLGRIPQADGIQESVENTREIRRQQDEAYQESLRTDRERARQARVQELREDLRQRQIQRRQAALAQVRDARISRLGEVEEPENGFTVRFRFSDGTAFCRRFISDMNIDNLICAAASHPDSTERFCLHVPGTGVIHSDRSETTLESVGLTVSTTVNVVWQEEDVDEQVPMDPLQSDADEDQLDEQLQNVEMNQPQTDTVRPTLGSTRPRRRSAALAGDFIAAVNAGYETEESEAVDGYESDRENDDTVAADTDPEASQDLEPAEVIEVNDDSRSSSSLPDIELENIERVPLSTLIDQANEETNQRYRILTVRRAQVMEDLISAFNCSETEDIPVRVRVSGEEAQDEDGVFRDVLTAFWQLVFDKYFEGEGQSAPVVCSSATSAIWAAIGRIFRRGFYQLGYIPVRFGIASLIYAILGREALSENTLQQCWVSSLGGFELQLMQRILSTGMENEDVTDVVEVVERYGVTRLPSQSNIRDLSLRCAEVTFIERAAYPLLGMGLSALSTSPDFQSEECISRLYTNLRPNGRSVSALLSAEPTNSAQQTALRYLRQAIKSFDDNLLTRFLRFVSGSDALTFDCINIQFVRLYGAQRRCVAHTCSVTLDLPTTYESYNEFLSELRSQLLSDVWEMDFV